MHTYIYLSIHVQYVSPLVYTPMESFELVVVNNGA